MMMLLICYQHEVLNHVFAFCIVFFSFLVSFFSAQVWVPSLPLSARHGVPGGSH